MTKKEREKLWYSTIKQVAKKNNWKFNSHFIFKRIGDLFFSANFFIHPKESELYGWLEYKTFNIDNVFWDIIDEKRNKEMPLSFRGNAAFCVRALIFKEYHKKISVEAGLENGISELLELIEIATQEKSKSVITLNGFMEEMRQNESKNSVGIITGLIEQNLIEQALSKIEEYKTNKLNSGFGFENSKDFYDLAKEYCEKKYC